MKLVIWETLLLYNSSSKIPLFERQANVSVSVNYDLKCFQQSNYVILLLVTSWSNLRDHSDIFHEDGNQRKEKPKLPYWMVMVCTCPGGGVLKSNCVANFSPKISSSTEMMLVYTAMNMNAFSSISKCFLFSFFVEYLMLPWIIFLPT